MTTYQTQCLLGYLGYLPENAQDGISGPKTKAAISAFQADYGLTVDGVAGEMTNKMLIAAIAGTAVKVEKPAENTEQTGTFWDEIEFFDREEFRCQCGGRYCNGFPVEMQEEEVRIDDEIRRRAGVPLRVNSGIRCERHNADPSVGGVWNSLHLTGQATDLAPINGNISVAKLYTIAEQVLAERIPGRGGLGRYDWGIHNDNGNYSRWNG